MSTSISVLFLKDLKKCYSKKPQKCSPFCRIFYWHLYSWNFLRDRPCVYALETLKTKQMSFVELKKVLENLCDVLLVNYIIIFFICKVGIHFWNTAWRKYKIVKVNTYYVNKYRRNYIMICCTNFIRFFTNFELQIESYR